MQLTELSDDALVSQLAALCLEGHRLTARLVVYLIEVEERRLDSKAACTSMFDFCVRRLGMSEGAAFRRINAARLVKRFPGLLARIESGELRLSTLVLLRSHLTHGDEAQAAALAAAVAGKTQREVEEVLARIEPRPDVPSSIAELPRPHVQVELGARGPEAVVVPAPRTPRGRFEPLSESRFKVQLTASCELRDKLERARDLMSHRNPSGDLAVVVERAVDLLLDQLERERLGKATRPKRASTTTATRLDPPRARGAGGAIPRAVRREVFARDGEMCTFVDAEGRRCPSRTYLELDHVHSRALGGPDDTTNLRVRCRTHNRLHAEVIFGKEHVARAIDFRQRKSRRVTDVEEVESPGRCSREAVAEAERTASDVALRGLVSLGFARSDACRALDLVARRRGAFAEKLPVQDVLRDAIAALT